MIKYQASFLAVYLIISGRTASSVFDYEDAHTKPMFDLAKEYIEGRGEDLSWLEDYAPTILQVGLHNLVNIVNSEEEDDSSCNICKAFFTAVKAITTMYTWEEVRDPVVEVCHQIFNQSENYVRHDVLCPGVVDLQGPHIFEIAKARHRKSAEEICTFLNSCLLPKTADKAKVREQEEPLEKTGTKKLWKLNHSERLKEQKKSALKIVQLTDIHIEPDYAEGSSTDCGLYVCCDMQYGPGDAGAYGDYSCNIPQRTVELFLAKTADLQPEVVLYSGDTPPNTLWDETYHSQLNCSVLLVEAMERHLGKYRVLPNIGNHEMFPTNLYSVEYLDSYTGPMNEEFIKMWSSLANFSVESEATMRQGGFYTELIRPGLRLLSFNTNYWYTFNWYNVLNDGSTEVQQMLSFMNDTLQFAKDNQEKVILQGHHPPGIADTIVLYSRLFEELLSEYAEQIILHVAGHTHSDEFRVHSDSMGDPISVMFASPSVSSSINKNPSMRVFYLDDATHELLDFEQYGFNLDQLNGSEEPTISFIYSAVEDYGLEDMSPASWRNLIDRMETEDELFAIYFNHYNTGYANGICNTSCRWRHLCHSQFYSYDDINACRKNIPTPTEIPTTTTPVNGGGVVTGHTCYIFALFFICCQTLQ